MAVATDPRLVRQGHAESLTEADAEIFDGMVIVDVGIALAAHGQVEEAVPRHLGEHVIDEGDSGLDLALAAAVENEAEVEVGLGGIAVNNGSTGHTDLLGPDGRICRGEASRFCFARFC